MATQREPHVVDRLLILVMAAATACLLTVVEGAIHRNGMIDLGVYRKGAWAFVHGRNPFGTALPGPHLPFTYTPFSAVVFAPLAYLSMHVATLVHTFLSLSAMCVACGVVLERVYGRTSVRHLVAMVSAAAVIVFFSEPVLQTLGFGQINLILMAMVLVDLLSWESKPWSGVLVGIAAGIKLTPLVFVVYLLVVRRYRAAAVAAATAAMTVAIGWVLMPGSSWQYFSNLMWDARRVGNVGYVANQSLNGMWTRLLGTDTSAKPFWAISALVVLVVGLRLASRVHVRLGEPAGLAVTAVVGLLVSPISWSHHWVWWMVPAIMLTVEAWRRRSVELAMWTVVWSLPFFVAPFWFVPHHDHRAMPHGVLQQLAASAYVWLGLAGLGVVWVWMLRDRHRIVVPEMTQPSPAQ